MEIKTKYNIGDKVYLLDKLNIYQATIEEIDIRVNRVDNLCVFYKVIACNGYINFYPSSSSYQENELFETPEEIINNIEIKVQK